MANHPRTLTISAERRTFNPTFDTAKSWTGYADNLRKEGFQMGAEIIDALTDALAQYEAAEKAAEEEAKRERFIVSYADYFGAELRSLDADVMHVGSQGGTLWYEITNPEEVGLTSYSPVVLPDPEPLPEPGYIEPSQVREGMLVEVEEFFKGLDEGAHRTRYTTGTVTESRQSAFVNQPKVGGVRVQLANRDDADVRIYFYGMAEGAA